jgi:ankyrin repeat protein
MTFFELAAHMGRSRCARRLIRAGAEPDLWAYWALGWKRELPRLLRRRPDLVNRPNRDDGDMTPLHYAAREGDVELVELLLEHGADRSAREKHHNGIPAGWARHFGHPELADRLAPGK